VANGSHFVSKTLQAEKLLLAEGSKLALVALESSYNQGVYGLVANLGSLAVRLLFTPVEEAAFTAFSRCGTPASCCHDPQLTNSINGICHSFVPADHASGEGGVHSVQQVRRFGSWQLWLLGLLSCKEAAITWSIWGPCFGAQVFSK
jgi:hypothetical protein